MLDRIFVWFETLPLIYKVIVILIINAAIVAPALL